MNGAGCRDRVSNGAGLVSLLCSLLIDLLPAHGTWLGVRRVYLQALLALSMSQEPESRGYARAVEGLLSMDF
jgi:hypothetical protein